MYIILSAIFADSASVALSLMVGFRLCRLARVKSTVVVNLLITVTSTGSRERLMENDC